MHCKMLQELNQDSADSTGFAAAVPVAPSGAPAAERLQGICLMVHTDSFDLVHVPTPP